MSNEWQQASSESVQVCDEAIMLLWLVIAGLPVGIKLCGCMKHGALLISVFPGTLARRGIQYVVEWPFGEIDHSMYEAAVLN